MAIVNPATVALASKAGSAISKSAPAAKETAQRVNNDTKNSLSWLTAIAVAAGLYTVWTITAPFRSGAGAVSNVIDAAGNIVNSAGQIVGNIFEDIINVLDPTIPPVQGTPRITRATATSKAALLYEAMSGLPPVTTSEFENVKKALRNMTIDDFSLIANEFGTPYYFDANPFGSGNRPRNLYQWLSMSLSNSQLNTISQMVPGLF